MSTMKSLGASLTVVGLLSGLAALAAPPVKDCTAYKVWSSGVMDIKTIQHDNQGSSVTDEAIMARLSAQSRCAGEWQARGRSAISYANSGGKVSVWTTDGGKTYQYHCMICDDLVGTLPARWKEGAATYARRAVEEKLEGRGEVVGVTPVFYAMEEATGVNYEVLVATDQHLARVFVDISSGEVVFPESMVDVVVIPENTCR
ncbi:hypothetical protein [Pyxidicoccus sp. MSG2]|uniref:hypothetical protein n=1 Tax=Pyxidicoccus sp. MSG2 TaxID=2996790 RepID=UPI00226D63C9|nr:hypothetical protein [Pyxidicoccus sp. MSG2]MCY1022532.1 hypothetical protein [Pyxidicoccus sp. MSG2]